MATVEKTLITVEATINAPVEKVWKLWNGPEHIVKWNSPSEDWHTPRAQNDLKVNGKLLSRMEAKDGSFGFDFEGTYNEIKENEFISYTIADGRKVKIRFKTQENKTIVTQTFEAEEINSVDMQKGGWQAILNSFKNYAESYSKTEKLHYEITINAPAEKVYNIMIGEKTYQAWTKVFSEGSHFVGSWEKGSKILFLGSDSKGEMGGMVSKIKENIPLKFVSIQHIGMVQNGHEITSGKEVDEWAGALENYTFEESNGATLLLVDLEGSKDFKTYFDETWPKALETLKEICEQ